jgi:hypothetical protein
MAFKWGTLQDDILDIPEMILEDKKDLLRGYCHSHTPDCGTIKESDQCQCGNNKNKRTLCSSCYYTLPTDLQQDVNWCPEAYKDALSYLNE